MAANRSYNNILNNGGENVVQEEIKKLIAESNKMKLAKDSGVDRRYLYHIISGYSTPSIEVVEKILGAMGKELTIRNRRKK